MLREFQIQADILPLADYREALQLLTLGEVDVVVVNSLVGHKLGVARTIPTHIIFNPVELHFASNRPEIFPLLDRIDMHLALLKSEPGSLYHQSMSRWLSDTPEGSGALPHWHPWVITGAMLFTLLLAALILSMRNLVRRHTRELRVHSEALSQEIQ